MTRKTRLALYRVRNHAQRLVQAIDALGPSDLGAVPIPMLAALGLAAGRSDDIAVRLTRILEDGDDA